MYFFVISKTVSLFFPSDSRRLEVCCHGNRSPAAVHFLPRDCCWNSRDTVGRASHIPIRGSGRCHRNAQRKGY